MNKELTPRQAAVYGFILSHCRKMLRSPTHQEISEHFGFKSHNSATEVIRALRKKGYLVDTGQKKQRITIANVRKKVQVMTKVQAMNAIADKSWLDELTQLGQEMGDYE